MRRIVVEEQVPQELRRLATGVLSTGRRKPHQEGAGLAVQRDRDKLNVVVDAGHAGNRVPDSPGKREGANCYFGDKFTFFGLGKTIGSR